MNRLKQLREEKGIFQKDIADYLGVSITAITYYENEKRDMSPDTIIKLAEYFDVSTDYLLGKSDVRNPNGETKISDLYMHLAKEAQELNLDKEDVDYIISLYKKYKK